MKLRFPESPPGIDSLKPPRDPGEEVQDLIPPHTPSVLDTSMQAPQSDKSGNSSAAAETSGKNIPPDSGKKTSSVLTALKCGPFWAGTGAAVACAGSLPGVLLHAAATLLSLRNELRTKEPESLTDADGPSWIGRGYPGLIRDLVRSPGFNMAVGALAYAVTAVQKYSTGDPLYPAFVSFVIAHAATTAVANQLFAGTRTNQTVLEKVWRILEKGVPARIQNVLKNPAPWFSIGNIMLVLPNAIETVPAKLFTLSPWHFSAAGVALAAGSLITGLSALLSRRAGSNPSGSAQYLNAPGSLFMGIGCLMTGAPSLLPIGIANLCWTVSNTIWGLGLDRRKNAEKKSMRQEG